MPRITPIHWRRFEKILLLLGCHFIREEGDHRVYARDSLSSPLIVPRYNPLPVFIMRNNLRVLGVSHEEYLKLLARI